MGGGGTGGIAAPNPTYTNPLFIKEGWGDSNQAK